MKGTKCVLCGQEYSMGLHILGCFLCFRCEQALLKPGAARHLKVCKRRRLAHWAGAPLRPPAEG